MRAMPNLIGAKKERIKMKNNSSIENFDNAPDSSLVSITAACLLSSRSRSSIYRHNQAGELPFVKLGKSTRIRVGDLRKLIGAAQ